MRLYDGSMTADVKTIDKNGVDWSMDLFNVGTLKYNDGHEAFEVESVEDCIDYALDWYNAVCDFEGEDDDDGRQLLIEDTVVTRTWKVYGADGHRQRESFNESYTYNFTNPSEGIRILEVLNSDRTGTNDYTIVRITRSSWEECEDEFYGQITDGIFENSRTGICEEI